MRYDPGLQLAKYHSVAAALRGQGFTVSVATEPRLLDSMGIEQAHYKDFSLFVTARFRGWFLHIPRTGMQMAAIYRVPHHSLIPQVLWAMLNEAGPIVNQPSQSIEKQFDLESVPYSLWRAEEEEEESERLSHFGWNLLSELELQRISPEYERYFFPGGVLRLPSPSSSWSFGVDKQDSSQFSEEKEMMITMHALRSFQLCMPENDELLVLDWQHKSYRWNVHRGIHKAYRDEWATPIVSSGDDIVYLSRDFHFGLMSLRDGTIHVFGQSFLEAFVHDLPAAVMSIMSAL